MHLYTGPLAHRKIHERPDTSSNLYSHWLYVESSLLALTRLILTRVVSTLIQYFSLVYVIWMALIGISVSLYESGHCVDSEAISTKNYNFSCLLV